MKKIILSFAISFYTFFAFAQMSPESFMTALGELPWANAFVDCMMDDNCDEKEAKLAEIEALQPQAQAVMKANATAAANKMMSENVAGTNVTNAQVANMSRAEQEALVRQSAANQLGAMGISAEDLAKLQSGQMTEEQLAAKMMQAQTGFSMQELQAMEKMTDEQKVAFVQSRGKAVSPAQNQQQQQKVADNQKFAELQAEAQKAMVNVQQCFVEYAQNRFDVQKQIRQIYELNYHAQFVAFDQRLKAINKELAAIEEKGGKFGLTEAQTKQYGVVESQIKVVQAQRRELERKMYNEITPMMLQSFSTALTTLRNRGMSEARKYGETQAKLYKLTGEAKYSNTDERAWTLATMYYEEFHNVLKMDFTRATGEGYNPQDEITNENQAKAALQREKATLEQLKAAL